ncbi:MAG: PH domain-containing protein [Anaerolineae bacterium]|nr:PH domain-containing protein [Anaerolineae bacterium]
MAKNERVVRTSRDHWIVLLPTILVDGVVSFIILALSIVGAVFSGWAVPLLGLLLLLVPVGHFLYRLWIWWNKRYVITDRRIIQVSGMVQKRVSDTLLEKINDIVTEQTAMGRLLKYGDVKVIAGSDSGADVFYRLADPIEFKKDLLDQKTGLDQLGASKDSKWQAESGAPSAADIPELIAELDELRKKGLLTDAEFQEKRRKLLDRI